MATVIKRGPAYRVTGLRDAVRDLERWGVDVSDLKDAFTKISMTVVRDARANINNRTGRLGNSVRPSRTKNKAVVRAGYKTRVQHARHVNYGTGVITAQRFLNRAANDKQHEHIRQIATELNRAIKRANNR